MGVGAAGEAEGAALQGGERLAAALGVRAAGGKDMQEIARRAGRTERPWGSERAREKAEQGARREAVVAGEISRANCRVEVDRQGDLSAAHQTARGPEGGPGR